MRGLRVSAAVAALTGRLGVGRWGVQNCRCPAVPSTGNASCSKLTMCYQIMTSDAAPCAEEPITTLALNNRHDTTRFKIENDLKLQCFLAFVCLTFDVTLC